MKQNSREESPVVFVYVTNGFLPYGVQNVCGQPSYYMLYQIVYATGNNFYCVYFTKLTLQLKPAIIRQRILYQNQSKHRPFARAKVYTAVKIITSLALVPPVLQVLLFLPFWLLMCRCLLHPPYQQAVLQ